MHIGPSRQRSCIQNELEVRDGFVARAFQESDQSAGDIARHARSKQPGAQHVTGYAVKTHSCEHRSWLTPHKPNDGGDVVLQVTSDAAEWDPWNDAHTPQLIRVTDTRQHENVR